MDDFDSRRAAVEDLAAAVRAVADATVSTAVDPAEIRAMTRTLHEFAGRLATATDDTPFSGLVRAPVDYSVPEGPMPLNPIIGACSPCRPDVHLRFVDGHVEGTASLTKRFTGPPGFVHGGITAMLADQLVALASGAIGARGISKSVEVRFRRPVPVGAALDLWSECTPDGDELPVRYTIAHAGEVLVEGTGQMVRWADFAERQARRAATD